MEKYSFEEMRKRLNELVLRGSEPEVSFHLRGKKYMIILYKDYCTFQRCGIKDSSGEVNYDSLEELYDAETIDDIQLKRDWLDIEDFYCLEF